MKFLDSTGLAHLWGKLSAALAEKQDAASAVTMEQVNEAIQAAISAGGGGTGGTGGTWEEVYSAQEQVIGRWIDGRPLYRKTVSQKQTISTGAAKNLVTLPEGCVIQRWDGYYVDRTSKYPLTCNTTNIVTVPNEMGDGLTVMECPLDWVCTYAAGNVLKLKAGENVYVSADIVVTVEYTKTADQGA